MCHFYCRTWIAFISYRRTTCLDRHQKFGGNRARPREQNIDAHHSPGVRRGPTSQSYGGYCGMRRIFRSSPATPGRTSLTASHVAVAPLRSRDCGQPARSGLNVLYTYSNGAGSWRTLCGLDARPRHEFAPPHSGQHRSGFGADECGGRRSRARAVGGSRRGADTGPLLRTLLRLRHDLVIIGRAAISPLPESFRSRIETPLARVGVAFADYLRASGAALQTSRGPPPLIDVESALDACAAEIAGLRREGLTRGLPGDVTERFFALGFGLEQMHQNFKDLEHCVAEWSGSVRSPAGYTCTLSASAGCDTGH
jgi:hypothetical protein